MTPPPSDRDEAWQAAQDAAATEEPPHSDVPEGAEPDWDLELAFYEELERETTRPAVVGDSTADDRMIAAALAQATPDAASRTGGARLWLAVALTAAAAVALMVLWPRSVLDVSRGTWVDEQGAAYAAGDSLSADVWLVADESACVTRGDAELCAEAGTRLRLQASEPGAELAAGGVWVESGQWVLLAGDTKRNMSSGDTFRIPERSLATAVAAPPVEPTRVADIVEPSADPVVPPPPSKAPVSAAPVSRPRTAVESAGALLGRARTQLGEGKGRAADKTYAQLLRAHPKSAEAGIARVALGQLRLKRGRAKSALGLFDAYLRGTKGPLAEEAAWGRIQALQALGKQDALNGAVAAFLTDHPRSVYRKRAQQSVSSP